MKELTEKEALARMGAYCASTERCAQEVVEKLRKWELSGEAVERIVATLENERYLDEERYCRCFVNDKVRFSKWGKRKIAQSLSQKRITPSVIRQQLKEVDQELYMSILKELLEAKKRTVRASSEYEYKGKLIRFALGRGFEPDDIEKVISME